jgi:hypothetical protein
MSGGHPKKTSNPMNTRRSLLTLGAATLLLSSSLIAGPGPEYWARMNQKPASQPTTSQTKASTEAKAQAAAKPAAETTAGCTACQSGAKKS